MGWRQGEHAHRAVNAAQVVKGIVRGGRKLFGHRGYRHFQIEPVRPAKSRGVGNVPFDRREEVFAVAQRMPIEPIARARVDGVEAQDDAVSSPILGQGKFPGHGDRFVWRHIKALLQPLAGDFERPPPLAVKRLCAHVIGGRGMERPFAIEKQAVGVQLRRPLRQRPVMHRLEKQVGLGPADAALLIAQARGQHQFIAYGQRFHLGSREAKDSLRAGGGSQALSVACGSHPDLRIRHRIIRQVQHLALQGSRKPDEGSDFQAVARRRIGPEFDDGDGGVDFAMNFPGQGHPACARDSRRQLHDTADGYCFGQSIRPMQRHAVRFQALHAVIDVVARVSESQHIGEAGIEVGIDGLDALVAKHRRTFLGAGIGIAGIKCPEITILHLDMRLAALDPAIVVRLEAIAFRNGRHELVGGRVRRQSQHGRQHEEAETDCAHNE